MNLEFIRGVGATNWLYRTLIRQIAKRVLRRGISIRLPTGLRMKIPTHSSHGTEVFITRANTDWGAEALFCRFADAGRDFCDIGSNIGYYSLYLSPCVRKIFAFEPDSRNFAGLRENIAAADNIEHIPLAISNRSGIVHLDVSHDPAVSRIREGPSAGSVAVEAVTLDQFLLHRPDAQIGLIKIDIEGHDVAALEGARQTVACHQPLILVEFGQGDPDAEFNNPARLIRFCDGVGYSIFAYTHTKPGRYQDRLIQLASTDFSTTKLKMLFLVPEQLFNSFKKIVIHQDD